MASHSETNKTLIREEQDLDGSSRLGEWLQDKTVFPFPYPPAGDTVKYDVFAGNKRYELTNHLGNVMGVITDRKIPKETGTPDSIAEYNIADIANIQDYYPFGMVAPGRSSTATSKAEYRFGFNGKECDNEWIRNNDPLNYGGRVYDNRLGRWLSVDLLEDKFQYISPYSFTNNSQLYMEDDEGDSSVVVILGESWTWYTSKVTGEKFLVYQVQV